MDQEVLGKLNDVDARINSLPLAGVDINAINDIKNDRQSLGDLTVRAQRETNDFILSRKREILSRIDSINRKIDSNNNKAS